MNALRPPARPPHGGPSPAGLQCAAVADAMAVVAGMAGIAAPHDRAALRSLPQRLRDAPAPRQALAEQALADLAAVLEAGLGALVAVQARGADPRAAATALWREYETARDAIMALLPPAAAGARRLG